MALFTRSKQPSIQDRVDLDLVMLSPSDQTQWLTECVDKMWDNSAEPILHYQHEPIMRGYQDVPDGDYWIQVHTPRIPIWVSKEDFGTSHYITWYDMDDNTLTYHADLYRADSILWVRVPTPEDDGFLPSRVTYAGKTIYLKCPKVQKNDSVLVYFIDQYGLPQCISLQKSEYKLGYDVLGSYRCYNDGLRHEYHKQANYTVTLSESDFQMDFAPYLNGFVLSEAYIAQYQTKNKDVLVECALTGCQTSIAKNENSISVVATMEIHPADALKIEPNYYEH